MELTNDNHLERVEHQQKLAQEKCERTAEAVRRILELSEELHLTYGDLEEVIYDLKQYAHISSRVLNTAHTEEQTTYHRDAADMMTEAVKETLGYMREDFNASDSQL